MPDTDSQNPTKTLRLYVRSLASADCIAYLDAVFDRVEQLKTGGQIAEYSVDVWGRQVRSATTTRTTVGKEIHETLASFRAWAERTGVSLDSFFTTKEVEVSFMDEAYTVLVLPVVTLAEYEDNDLTFVAPCSTGDTIHTVQSRLETLGTAEEETAIVAPSGAAPVTPGGSPDA